MFFLRLRLRPRPRLRACVRVHGNASASAPAPACVRVCVRACVRACVHGNAFPMQFVTCVGGDTHIRRYAFFAKMMDAKMQADMNLKTDEYERQKGLVQMCFIDPTWLLKDLDTIIAKELDELALFVGVRGSSCRSRAHACAPAPSVAISAGRRVIRWLVVVGCGCRSSRLVICGAERTGLGAGRCSRRSLFVKHVCMCALSN